MPNIHVRTARLAESEVILRLVRESMTSYCRDSAIPNHYIEATTEPLEVVEDAIASGVVFVAVTESDEILGTCRLYIRPRREMQSELKDATEEFSSRVAYFARFSVWDSWRSRGIGNFLLTFCEKTALQSGCSHMFLHTALSNKGMVNYYQAHGFEIISQDSGRGYNRGLFMKRL